MIPSTFHHTVRSLHPLSTTSSADNPPAAASAMHTPPPAAAAAAAARPPRRGDRYVVRLSPALAALCGQENCYEDEVLGKLRAVALALSTAVEAAEAAGVAGAAAAAMAAMLAALLPGVAASRRDTVYEVGRCRLTLSKSVLKAPSRATIMV